MSLSPQYGSFLNGARKYLRMTRALVIRVELGSRDRSRLNRISMRACSYGVKQVRRHGHITSSQKHPTEGRSFVRKSLEIGLCGVRPPRGQE